LEQCAWSLVQPGRQSAQSEGRQNSHTLVVLFSCVAYNGKLSCRVCNCEQRPKACMKHALMGQSDPLMENSV